MSNYKDEIRAMLAKMDKQENQGSQDNTQPPPADDIQDVYMVIVREHEDVAEEQAQIVDSTPPTAPETKPPHALATISAQPDAFLSAYIFVGFSLFFILATLTFQLYSMFNPPIATVTIVPKSQPVTLTGTLQLGRLLPPMTLSQSQTTTTTGHGHQDARAATGTVTFYNGLFTQQTVAQGSVYTGQDGVEVITTQSAMIPPGDPSTGYGTATVTAQALQAGRKGNIQAGDVSITINNGLLVRNNQFYQGQDERNFSTVRQQDMNKVSTPLKISVAQSIKGALTVQAKQDEKIVPLPCSPTVTSDHQVGQEATQVKVTVSETCSAAAYEPLALATRATQLLTTQALKKLGSGYRLLGNMQLAVKQATITNATPHLVFLSFQARGTWVYGLAAKAQDQIKQAIAGKTKEQAAKIISAMPGIARGSISLTGFTDETRLPKNSQLIQVVVLDEPV
jgi:Baseplate J-like protein